MALKKRKLLETFLSSIRAVKEDCNTPTDLLPQGEHADKLAQLQADIASMGDTLESIIAEAQETAEGESRFPKAGDAGAATKLDPVDYAAITKHGARIKEMQGEFVTIKTEWAELKEELESRVSSCADDLAAFLDQEAVRPPKQRM